MKNLFYILFCLFIIVNQAEAQTMNQNYIQGEKESSKKIQSSLSGDIVLKYGTGSSGIVDQLYVRELEWLLILPLHEKFSAQASLAMHLDEGHYDIEAHEAYISANTLIPHTQLKLGKFFLGIGRLNRVHRHEWPFISAPKVHRDFFDEEGLSDTGLEGTILLPTPFYWGVTAGVGSGWTFGHSHDAGNQPQIPSHYVRSAFYWDMPNHGGMSLGLNYLGRKDHAGTYFHYAGLDFVSKWREGKRLKWLLQGEFWSKIQKPDTFPSETTLGAYLYAQYSWHDHWAFGVRGDYYSNISLKNLTGRSVANGTYAIVPTLTYQPSERLKFRVAYTAEYEDLGTFAATWKHAGEFQLTFLVGKHPAHEF